MGLLRDTTPVAPPFYWREAALCAPGMPLILVAGIASGHVAYAAVAAGAAFSVGFGAARDFRGYRWASMIAAALGMTVAAFAGSIAGQWPAVLVLLSAGAAAGCAALALFDEDLWWISLQVVIALLVAGYFPGTVEEAFARAGIVLAGGAVQILVVVALAKLAPSAARALPAAPPRIAPSRRLLLSHTIRAAACVSLSLWLARRLGLANWYWAPMTAMLVLKPGLSETHTRGFARLGGTLAGCIAATVFEFCVAGSQAWLLAGIALSASASFALQKAHYAILSSVITATVVLLLVFARTGGVIANAEHRLIATLLGGCVALVGARIVPHRPYAEHPGADRVGAA